jgi:hypothetical protein
MLQIMRIRGPLQVSKFLGCDFCINQSVVTYPSSLMCFQKVLCSLLFCSLEPVPPHFTQIWKLLHSSGGMWQETTQLHIMTFLFKICFHGADVTVALTPAMGWILTFPKGPCVEDSVSPAPTIGK